MIVKIVKVNLGLLWLYCGQCGVSSFSDSSLVWLIFLKIYTSKAVPCYSFCLLVSSVSVFRPDTRGTVVDSFFF